MFTLLVIIVILALIFDYINGFHDAANSIATIVSTKVLTPFQAVVWALFSIFPLILFPNTSSVNSRLVIPFQKPLPKILLTCMSFLPDLSPQSCGICSPGGSVSPQAAAIP